MVLTRVKQYCDQVVAWLRAVFIVLMTVLLAVAMVSLAGKLWLTPWVHGWVEFNELQILLNDALFVLIIIAITKSLFINDSFSYALTFLEVGFVVLLRKLILIEATPETTWELLMLGIVSALFFTLILLTYYLKQRITPKPIAVETIKKTEMAQ